MDTNVKKVQEEQKLVTLPIDCIRANQYQPRRFFAPESIEELSQSLKQFGLLQPITVRYIQGGQYELIAGERRLRAAKKAGWHYIDAIVTNSSDAISAIFALIENVQRENLHFFEEAQGYYLLLRDHRMTQEELAVKLCKTQSTIANKLRVLKLPKAVRDQVLIGRLTERHARALLRLDNEELQLKAVEVIRMRQLSVKATEDMIQRMIERQEEVSAAPGSKKILKLFHTSRIFINTIAETVKSMVENGIKSTMDVIEADEEITLVIKVPK